MTIIIQHYRERVGVRTYLSQMLGELAEAPLADCALYWPNGERVPVSGDGGQPVQKFLRRRFGGGVLPFMVKVNEEVKYL